MQTKQLAHLLEQTLDENKASDIKVLDVSKLTSVTDNMIIATGRSERHNRSLADRVVEAAKELGVKPLGVEGGDTGQGEWVLVDLAYVIVHVMLQETRDFYNLEALWSQHLPRKEKPSNEEE